MLDDTAVGFAPVSTPEARILILGSMPGQRSLADTQYYAHPRNAFWFIMGELVGAGPDVPYQQRLILLQKAGIALWDVLRFCERPGSLDADIKTNSMIVNDFDDFFHRHPGIKHVFLNGGKAAELYRKNVTHADIPTTRLPSTSPAMASLSREEKLAAWSVVSEHL